MDTGSYVFFAGTLRCTQPPCFHRELEQPRTLFDALRIATQHDWRHHDTSIELTSAPVRSAQ